MKFTEFNLNPDILRGLDAAGFTECTKVQESTIGLVINQNKDVTVQSQTGTGKTAAFLISAFQLLLENPSFKGKKALIVAPTRELAVQIDEECKVLGQFLPLKSAPFYGGVGYGAQEDFLKVGVDIVIGTPGRLLDFISSRKIDPREFAIVVIDEADRLLDMGFYPDIKKLFGKLVKPAERRTFLLSATMSTRVSNIAWEHMNDPALIEIEPENITVEAIEQRLFHVSSDEKMRLLLGILAHEKPANALVFTNTKRKAEEVAKRLEINGYPAHFIMGDLPQKKRLSIINEVKAGNVSYLVATDVAARGLHIQDLDLVVNYDLPEDAENYVHRIGRTARAGRSGKAVSMACEHFVYGLAAIEKFINNKIPVAEVSDELLAEDKSSGIRIRLSSWDEDGNEQEYRPGTGRRGSSRPESRRPFPGGRDRNERRPGPESRESREQRESRYAPRAPEQAAGPVGAPPAPRPPRTPRPESARTNQGEAANGGRQPRARTVEERLAYYREKYGESFQATPELMDRLRREEARDRSQGDRNGRAQGGGAPRQGNGNGNSRGPGNRGGGNSRGQNQGGRNQNGGNQNGGNQGGGTPRGQNQGGRNQNGRPQNGPNQGSRNRGPDNRGTQNRPAARNEASNRPQSPRPTAAPRPAEKPVEKKGIAGLFSRIFGRGTK